MEKRLKLNNDKKERKKKEKKKWRIIEIGTLNVDIETLITFSLIFVLIVSTKIGIIFHCLEKKKRKEKIEQGRK